MHILLDKGTTAGLTNWKIFAEGFLEGYHIKPTHRETFFPFVYDNLNIVETYGRNGRITYPFQRMEKLIDVVEAIQRGIASGANEHFTFGRHEKLIGHFHRNLHDLLGDSTL